MIIILLIQPEKKRQSVTQWGMNFAADNFCTTQKIPNRRSLYLSNLRNLTVASKYDKVSSTKPTNN